MAGKGNPPGTNRGGGMKKGQKKRATLERELREAQALIEQQTREREAAAAAMVEVANPRSKLPKEVMRDAMTFFYGLAAQHQPTPGNEQADDKKFEKYLDKAADIAAKLAPYEHQRMPQAIQVTPLPVDLSKLTSEELDDFERLYTKATANAGGDTGRESPALTSH